MPKRGAVSSLRFLNELRHLHDVYAAETEFATHPFTAPADVKSAVISLSVYLVASTKFFFLGSKVAHDANNFRETT